MRHLLRTNKKRYRAAKRAAAWVFAITRHMQDVGELGFQFYDLSGATDDAVDVARNAHAEFWRKAATWHNPAVEYGRRRGIASLGG